MSQASGVRGRYGNGLSRFVFGAGSALLLWTCGGSSNDTACRGYCTDLSQALADCSIEHGALGSTDECAQDLGPTGCTTLRPPGQLNCSELSEVYACAQYCEAFCTRATSCGPFDAKRCATGCALQPAICNPESIAPRSCEQIKPEARSYEDAAREGRNDDGGHMVIPWSGGDASDFGLCESADDCPAPLGCSAATSTCAPCANDAECSMVFGFGTYRCSSDQSCVQAQCLDDGDCDAAEVCRTDTHVCITGNCLTQQDCAAGQLCLSFNCSDCSTSNQCGSDQVCNPDTRHCIAGDCTSRLDCPEGRLCTSFRCADCTATADCDDDEVCRLDTQRCVTGDCLSNADCSAGQACIDFHCASCVDSGDCAPNERCRTDTHTCVNGNCLVNGDCSSELVCASFSCGNCTSSSQCDSGEVCRADTHVCVAGDCLANSDCSSGLVCTSFSCDNCASSSQCDSGEVCRSDTHVCVAGDCASNDDCSSELVCSNFSCGNCASSSQCDSGEVCRADTHVCVAGDCASNVDCSSELVCANFSCDNCTSSSQCSIGRLCRPDTHICSIGNCTRATDCSNGLCGSDLQCRSLITTDYFSSTGVAIPSGPAVVSLTLDVFDADPFLWDLNVTTLITHSSGADIDLTLTSPSGTVVTLTTDNAGGNDDTFNGTLWDDSANPGGALPYTNNDGLASDRTYLNLTTATPLAPEEPLGAFFGEDPNGTWTLTLSDDTAGDAGNIEEFSLSVTPAIPTAIDTKTYVAPLTPVALSDPGISFSTLDVPADTLTRVCKVTVFTDISHPFSADIDMALTSPTGTIVTLTTDNGGGNANVFAGATWDDAAAPGNQVPYTTAPGQVTDHPYVDLTPVPALTPQEGLSAFRGEAAQGTWTLSVSDDTAGNAGTLNSWSLTIDRCFF